MALLGEMPVVLVNGCITFLKNANNEVYDLLPVQSIYLYRVMLYVQCLKAEDKT